MLTLSIADHLPRDATVLCLGAHSDDIEIGCGGTLLQLLAALPGRVRVHWVVLSATPERAEEARGSAACFLAEAGRSQVRCEAFRDGYFPYVGGDIKDFLESLKRELPAPDLVFTHYRDDRHQDHRVVSDLAWNTYRDHLVLEYEIPKYDGDMGRPNAFVPLRSATCRRKVDLLLEHFPSQHDHRWFTRSTFEALMRLRGVECNAPSGYAEAFYARKVVLG
jgi:LmbE family N-acetylglucosaminyl deacetylase